MTHVISPHSGNETIFLTHEEAITAVCIDLCQYTPQVELFRKLFPIIIGNHASFREDPKKNGTWICIPPEGDEFFFSWKQVGAFLSDKLPSRSLSSGTLTKICQTVFQTQVYPWTDISSETPGFRIETHMEQFQCRQCGQCCLSLDYHRECTEDDFDVWRKLGRTDIMEWVGFEDDGGKNVPKYIWVYPGTNQFTKVCPWLKKIPNENKYICRIHDVKPEICRQYPGTRKHALMTGCPGFNHSSCSSSDTFNRTP